MPILKDKKEQLPELDLSGGRTKKRINSHSNTPVQNMHFAGVHDHVHLHAAQNTCLLPS